jgi:hypothetical protein
MTGTGKNSLLHPRPTPSSPALITEVKLPLRLFADAVSRRCRSVGGLCCLLRELDGGPQDFLLCVFAWTRSAESERPYQFQHLGLRR